MRESDRLRPRAGTWRLTSMDSKVAFVEVVM